MRDLVDCCPDYESGCGADDGGPDYWQVQESELQQQSFAEAAAARECELAAIGDQLAGAIATLDEAIARLVALSKMICNSEKERR
jgi:hypothetical protein